MGMKRSNATNSPETKAASVLHSLASLSLSQSLPPLFPYVLFLEVSLSQIKALNQNLSKSRMLRAMSFTPNRARARTHTHTTLSVTMTMCLHQT